MSIPSHLFSSEIDGALYDTRSPNWSRLAPLRPNYGAPKRLIRSLADVKSALRYGPYAWPGGYPMYFITHDGAALLFRTVREQWRQIVFSYLPGYRYDGWRIVGCEINYEDDDLYDDHTGEKIPCFYKG